MFVPIPVGGSGGKKVVTGSFTGNGTRYASITGLDFEPTNFIIEAYSLTTYTAFSLCVIDGNKAGFYNASSAAQFSTVFTYSYSGGTLSLDTGSSVYLFGNGVTYRYILTE